MVRSFTAAAAMAGLLLAGCASAELAGDQESPTSTVASPSEPTASATEPAGPPWANLGEAVDLGDGVLVDVTPDGNHLWVRAPDPESTMMGCEGMPFEFLWTVDPATGERRRAIAGVSDDDTPLAGSIVTHNAPDGKVLIVGACEGYLSSLDIGTVAGDGTITDLTAVPTPNFDVFTRTVRWLPGGTELMAIGVPESGHPGLHVADATVGEWNDVDDTPYADWVPLGDGRIAAIQDGMATFLGADGSEFASLVANEVIPGPHGMPALALWYGDGDDASGRLDLVSSDGTFTRLADVAGYSSALSDDGAWATWSTVDENNTIVVVLHDLATGQQQTLDEPYFSGMAWLDTGIAWVVEGEPGNEDFAFPTVRFRPYTG